MPSIPILIVAMPILAAILIGLKAPARNTAMIAAIANVMFASLLCLNFDHTAPAGVFQFASSLAVLDQPTIALAFGVDGMNRSFTTKCSTCHSQIHGSDLPAQSLAGAGFGMVR